LTIPSLEGWELWVYVPIVLQGIPDPAEEKKPEDRKAAQDLVDKFTSSFSHPGDYSVQRLYAQLSGERTLPHDAFPALTERKAATWSKLDYEYSYAGKDDDGSPLKYMTWMSRASNDDAAMRLELWLRKWAREQDNNAQNAVGVTFRPKGERSK
jgi:hypothetical protein